MTVAVAHTAMCVYVYDLQLKAAKLAKGVSQLDCTCMNMYT